MCTYIPKTKFLAGSRLSKVRIRTDRQTRPNTLPCRIRLIKIDRDKIETEYCSPIKNQRNRIRIGDDVHASITVCKLNLAIEMTTPSETKPAPLLRGLLSLFRVGAACTQWKTKGRKNWYIIRYTFNTVFTHRLDHFFRPPGPAAAGRVGLHILLLYFIFFLL